MNINVTSKDTLVKTAREIAKAEGLSKISMRRIAVECDISVGAIYNYFPTKNDLMLAVIEDIWRTAFHGAESDLFKEKSFSLFVSDVYKRLYYNVQAVYENWAVEMTRLDLNKKREEQEAKYFAHIKKGLQQVLEKDRRVCGDIWTVSFTQMDFIDFIFDNLLLSLGKKEKNCCFLVQIIEKILYL